MPRITTHTATTTTASQQQCDCSSDSDNSNNQPHDIKTSRVFWAKRQGQVYNNAHAHKRVFHDCGYYMGKNFRFAKNLTNSQAGKALAKTHVRRADNLLILGRGDPERASHLLAPCCARKGEVACFSRSPFPSFRSFCKGRAGDAQCIGDEFKCPFFCRAEKYDDSPTT